MVVVALAETLNVVLGKNVCWVTDEKDQLAPAGSEVVDYCCSYSCCSSLVKQLSTRFCCEKERGQERCTVTIATFECITRSLAFLVPPNQTFKKNSKASHGNVLIIGRR